MFLDISSLVYDNPAGAWASLGPCLVVHDARPTDPAEQEIQAEREEEWLASRLASRLAEWMAECWAKWPPGWPQEASPRIHLTPVEPPVPCPAGTTLSQVGDPLTFCYMLGRPYDERCHVFPRETDPAIALDFCRRVIEPAIEERHGQLEQGECSTAAMLGQTLAGVEAAGLIHFPWFVVGGLSDPYDGSHTLFFRTRPPHASPPRSAPHAKVRPLALRGTRPLVSLEAHPGADSFLLPQLWRAGHHQWRGRIQRPPWLPAGNPEAWLATWVAHYAPRFRAQRQAQGEGYPQEALLTPLADSWLPRLIVEAPRGESAALVRVDDPASLDFLLTVLPCTDHAAAPGFSALFALSGRLRPDAQATWNFCETRLRPGLVPLAPAPLAWRNLDLETTRRWPLTLLYWDFGGWGLLARRG